MTDPDSKPEDLDQMGNTLTARAGSAIDADRPHRSRGATSIVGWAVVSRCLAAAAFFAVNMVLARDLGVDAFGTAAVVVSVSVFGAFAVSGGTNRSSLREVSAALATGNPSRAARALHDVVRILRWSVPIGGLLSFVAASALTWSTGDGLLLGLGGALLSMTLGVVLVTADVMRALGETRLSSMLAGRSGGAVVQLVFLVVLLGGWLAGGMTAVSAIVLYALAVGLVLVPSLIVLFRWREKRVGGVEPAVDGSAVHVRNSLPFLVNQMALLANGQVDLWTGSVVLSEQQVGLYAAGLRPVAVVSLPQQASELVMTPRIAALHARGEPIRMEREARTSATFATIGSLVLIVPLLVAPELILTVAFGSDFVDATPVLRILAVGQLFNAFTGPCNAVLTMTGRERLVMTMSIVGVCASLTASIVGSLLGGTTGLAIGAAATTAGLWLVMWMLARRVAGVWTHASGRILLRSIRRAPA
jgi:O-antigen/teichoic acid export membrane protein